MSRSPSPRRRSRARALAALWVATLVATAAPSCGKQVIYILIPHDAGSGTDTGGASDGVRDATPEVIAPPCPTSYLIGYATVEPVTNGGAAGGMFVTASTQAELDAYGRTPGPLIIQIDGMIAVSDQADITQGDKTIVGMGPGAGLVGGGLRVKSTSNVIIQNLKIVNAFGTDAITLETADHVWIDHCELTSTTNIAGDVDDLIDITRGSDFITVSWSRIHDHPHDVSVIGNSDTAITDDMGKLHVTLHHNLFANNPSHDPSVRFGMVHAFNNHYVNILPGVGIASRMGAIVRVEKNYFDNVGIPLTTHFDPSMDGFIQDIDNKIVNSGASPNKTEMPLDLPYAFTPDPADQVPGLVDRCAGVGILP